MRPSPKPAEWNAPPNPEIGARHWQNNVELEWNGRNWLPVVNRHNYPKLFNPDGTRRDLTASPYRCKPDNTNQR